MNKKGEIIGLALIAIMVVSLFIAVIPSVMGNGSKPDLTIEKKTEIWDTCNKTYHVNYTVKNNGTANATACHYTALYVNGVLKELKMVPVLLMPGENYSDTFDTALKCTAPGVTITVCADYYDIIDESNETNNCKENTLECKPDLIIEEKKEIRDPCTDTYTVQYTVKNQGNATAPVCHYTALYVDGVLKERKMVPVALEPCDSRTYTFDTVITCSPPGDTIKVCADTFDTVDEWNETNNCVTNELKCKPDLIIEDKKEIWDGCNRTYTVQYTVKNVGNATAGESKTGLKLDEMVVSKDPVPALKPCEDHTATFAWTHECAQGTDNITVCADIDGDVDEWNETNNCKENEIRCKPDLVITEKKEDFVGDGKYKVTYTIKNKGNATALKGHSTRLYVDGQAKECKAVPVDLKPCESYTDTFTAVIECTPPKDTIKVCADDCDGGIVDEWNETNNCLENDLACGPDLVVESKKETGTGEEGKYTVTYTIHNKGTATAKAGHSTTLYVDGIEIEKKVVPVDLKPCETHTDTFDTVIMCTPPGDTIKVCADNCNVIEEVNETNNCLENYLACGPDLVVTEKWEEWVNETHYNVSFTIKNQGDMTAYYPFWIALLVFDGPGDYTGEGGTVVSQVQIDGGLAPGETWTDTFPWASECTPLSDTIIVYVDWYNNVTETNETNNCLENVWRCGPDLVITDKEEEWVQAGGNYIVHYTIKNIGNMTAPAGHDTTLKVDGNVVDHKEVPVALAPGETYTDTFDAVVMITPPSDTIEVCADNFNEVLELDETNNCLENEWAYDEKPDLVIKKIWEKDCRRGTYKVIFEIKNIGTAPTPRRVRHHVVLFVDGVEIAKKTIRRTLDPGEIYKSHFRARITCSGGFDTIKVCADKFDVIDELNEGNNCLEKIHPC